MRTVLTWAAGLLPVVALASAVQAADVKPAAAPAGPEVHRMVILNGPTETIHYFAVGLSTSDQAALGDLERAENDAAYARDLQLLRRRYVADELILAPHRSAVQYGLYGRSVTRNYADYATAVGYGPGYYSYPYGWGGYGGAYTSSFAGSSSTVAQSLAYGVGDEGALKTAMAPVIASQANPEFAASAAHAYAAAVNRAGESESLRTALNLNPRGVVAANAESARKVTLTLKNGEKVDGTVADEDSDWITVDTATDQVSVRRADVTRVDRHKK